MQVPLSRFIYSVYYRDILDSSRAGLFARKERTEQLVQRAIRYPAWHTRNKEGKKMRREVRKRKGSREARSILVQCMWSLLGVPIRPEGRDDNRAHKCRWVRRPDSHANAHVAGPRRAQRDPRIGKYLGSVEKYLEYVCTCMWQRASAGTLHHLVPARS